MLFDRKNNHSILIDPGDKAELLINYLTQNNLQLTAILLTHGHFDHIGAIDELVEKYNCPVYILINSCYFRFNF